MLSYSRLFALCILSILIAAPAAASVTVEGMTLISKKRVGRTSFDYTYRITVSNDTAVDIEEVAAYLTTTGVGTTIIDDTAIIGTVPKGSSLLSTDTITLRQDRRRQLDLDALQWEVGFNAVITISGIVTDEPIGNAIVQGTVTRIESGRPVVESGRPVVEAFSAPAGPDGTYSFDLVGVSDNDFIDLNATGVGSQTDVELSSNVGSVGTILEEATEGSILVGSGDVPALKVTHVTTALNVLAIKANGGQPFTNDTALAAAQAKVDNEELLLAAALIKVVVDNANIGLPPGVQTTKQMIENQAVFEAFLAQVQEENPEEFQQAIEETIAELSLGYDSAEVPGEMYLSYVRINPLVLGGYYYNFVADGSGTSIDFNGQSDIDWSIDSAGTLIVDRLNPPTQTQFANREDPPGSGNFVQVEAQYSVIQHRVTRFAVGLVSDQVVLGTTDQLEFPNNPAIPTEITVNDPTPTFAYLSFRNNGIVPYANTEISGNQIALDYFHQDNNSESTGNPDHGADVFLFNADGSGQTARREYGFTWLIDGLGRLVITFDNGNSNIYARYSAAFPDPSVLVGQFGGNAGSINVLSIMPTPGLVFSGANLNNQKFRSAFQIVEPDPEGLFGVPRFDFTFLDDGTGCRDSGISRPFTWSTNADGYVILLVELPDGTVFRKRSWQLLLNEPGDLGERFWLIENLNFLQTGPETDPTETPGRINYYENIADVSNNTPPVANPDAAVTDVDTPVTIDVLANDVDSEGGPIILVSWTQGDEGGTVNGILSPSGAAWVALTYTPPQGVSGTDTFTYTIADGSCSISVEGSVTVDIN